MGGKLSHVFFFIFFFTWKQCDYGANTGVSHQILGGMAQLGLKVGYVPPYANLYYLRTVLVNKTSL